MKIPTLGILLLSLVVQGCVQGHCRRQVDEPAAPAPLTDSSSKSASVPPEPGHVFIYKYDGSLQCGMGKPVEIEAMAKDLKGIPYVSAVKKHDGLMHIQVCGSLTGAANVFEIPAKFLRQAESRGFKKWSFD
jgi:hypothetical protein